MTLAQSISIHALLAESDCKRCHCPQQRTISIHALLAESDHHRNSLQKQVFAISIHALLAESDVSVHVCAQSCAYFYPRSPCGERLKRICFNAQIPKFLSTLSLRRATTHANRYYVGLHLEFLSTLSLRRATEEVEKLSRVIVISIHALLAESDNWPRVMVSPTLYFYPRSPCGERPHPFCAPP